MSNRHTSAVRALVRKRAALNGLDLPNSIALLLPAF
jgi:hypothetical protein